VNFQLNLGHSPNHKDRKDADREAILERLYGEIGKLKVELDWLKKKQSVLGK
jgi:hypothetical protein